MAPKLKVVEIRSVRVSFDPHLSFQQRLDAGKYDKIFLPSDIEKRIRPSPPPAGTFEIPLVGFRSGVTRPDVVRYFEDRGRRSLSLEEVLDLGAQHPDLQRTLTIVALASLWNEGDGENLALLDGNKKERGVYIATASLNFSGFDPSKGQGYCFPSLPLQA